MTIDKVKRPKKQSWVPAVLIGIAIAYLFLVQYIPAINVFFEAFKKGTGPFLSNLAKPEFLHAAWLTLLLAAISIPVNAVFGLCAAWAIARHKFPGRAIVLSIIDLPFSISPVVAGLMIVLLYGRQGWFGPWLQAHDIKIVFAFPGMLMATAFVSMPFVAREVIPVLEEFGKDQEEAARTLGANDWQTFWRVTLPSIRWGLLYGLILTNARAMGEFGAVSVVSGNIANTTQTLPLFVEDAYKQYETEAAFSAAVLLAFLAVITLILKEIIERKTEIKEVE
ncbi:MAG: sulfate ABC transporter permease subunit CysW [Nostocales cyanobacterium LE14-WE4]|jgi:sulfate transport system permease protein|uniref:Sulfate ABC transporter permease subunit CysW n=1 Tax=Dolichospermum flos-aquae CCAP 1403/13F TaxID=315271 RepID=A0A6H2C0C2_DOLFA|nr:MULTISPECIES: sulfate ABC transporter permease subunit CysW [Nostocales]MBJ7296974.1 sulfate ABC transporter permease subunit CysW [Dolichospermum sp.]MBS9386118.1 sulfate ABC transporter permease subunit CysW [Dolichospermum sp. BR01]MBS9389768.1 sulfate ABC transporter permease subunit CysW [Dolichospermum sp. WA123]MCE2698997.1 sulfate ABC transporter permease subunit CysW [Anabaena sp. 49633_E8]MDJ0502611.1 sulfate ABC transporter permease subunit CysW [Nostocales cyanobacterium LE14-WE